MSELLNVEYALSLLDGQVDLLKDLLENFINDKLLDRFHLLELEEAQDKIPAAKYVHYFKGAARQLGATKLASSGQNLEDALRNNQTEHLKELTDAFTRDYADTYKAMEDCITDLGSS